MQINPSQSLRGQVQLPGDKSISHRYAILGGMASGVTRISGYSPSKDCQSTLSCLESLGVTIRQRRNDVTLQSPGWKSFLRPSAALDAENSGTTIRLLSGVLAGRPFSTTIGGDDSLNRRPMKRIITPLTQMGASIEARPGELPPLRIRGTSLHGIRYTLPVASAQVKSCVLLAGLTASGSTTVIEQTPSRDHTERALPIFGADIEQEGLSTTVAGNQTLTGSDTIVPGDFSAASFLILASLLVPGSDLLFPRVGINPTRTGVLLLLERAGLQVRKRDIRSFQGEPVCDLRVWHQPDLLADFPPVLKGDWIPNVIDEIPVLAVFGTRLPNGLRVCEASELRKKESDRISAVVTNLQALGLQVEELPDGFHIPPGQRIQGGRVRTFGDHRIAMAFAIAGLIAEAPVELDDPDCVAVSFPGFFDVLASVTSS